MSALATHPVVMINRIVLREADSTTPHLAKVAKLRMDLMAKAEAEEARAAMLSPTGEAEPLNLDSGAVVDRLV